MKNVSLIEKRFSELVSQIAEVEATKRYVQEQYFKGDRIDTDLLLGWRVKARNLIILSCGNDSEHYKEFVKLEKPQSYRSTIEQLNQLKTIFLAAREDYEGGYMTSLRNLVQAEVFDNELEQARELLANKYLPASAVIAGVVLETALRQLCASAGLPIGKLDKMNSDLTKAGTYSLLVQKRITALADIRNNAAHGHPEKFKESDVSDMISYIESFVSEHL